MYLKFISCILFIIFTQAVVAQTGTYRLTESNGASCTVAVMQEGQHVSADIFAWWHTDSGRHGVFSGEGMFKNNSCILKGQDNADCKVMLTFSPGKLYARFSDCMTENLPADFSGTYKKITDQIPGDYRITNTKAYFYKDANTKNQMKAYLIKGNMVSIDLENITDGRWVFVNYTNAAGKLSSGYLQWSVLAP